MLFVVKLVHIIIRFFLVATPFIGTDYWLSLHLMVIPFVLLHWLTNQTVCFLTEMEKLLTRKDGDQTFFGQVFTPVYKNESFVGSILGPIYTVKDKDEEKGWRKRPGLISPNHRLNRGWQQLPAPLTLAQRFQHRFKLS